MASEPFPVATLIASGQIDKVARAAMPTMMGVAAMPGAFGHATRLFDNAERISRLFDNAERVARLTGAAYVRSDAIAAFFEPPAVFRDFARASALVERFTKPAALDALQLFQNYSHTMAMAERVAGAYVAEDVLPALVVPDAPDGAVAVRTARLSDLTPEQKRLVREQVERIIVALVTCAGITTGQKAVALAGPCLMLAFALRAVWAALAPPDDE